MLPWHPKKQRAREQDFQTRPGTTGELGVGPGPSVRSLHPQLPGLGQPGNPLEKDDTGVTHLTIHRCHLYTRASQELSGNVKAHGRQERARARPRQPWPEAFQPPVKVQRQDETSARTE